MRKKPTTKPPYFTMESAMTAILRDTSEKMHHGILFDRRLGAAHTYIAYIRDYPRGEKLVADYESNN